MASSNEQNISHMQSPGSRPNTPSMDDKEKLTSTPSRPRFTSGEFSVTMDSESECKNIDPENEIPLGGIVTDTTKAEKTAENVADENHSGKASNVSETELETQNADENSSENKDTEPENEIIEETGCLPIAPKSDNEMSKTFGGEDKEAEDKNQVDSATSDEVKTDVHEANTGIDTESANNVSVCNTECDLEAKITDSIMEDDANADTHKDNETTAVKEMLVDTIKPMESDYQECVDNKAEDASESSKLGETDKEGDVSSTEHDSERHIETMEIEQLDTKKETSMDKTESNNGNEDEQVTNKDSEQKASYSTEFEKFLTMSSDKKKDQPASLKSYPIRSKQTEKNGDVKRRLMDLESEDTTNSSWYKISDKSADGSGDAVGSSTRLLPFDESSNMSTPDDCSNMSGNIGSVVSSNIEDNSRLSFTDPDEESNLSAPGSVPTFTHQPVFDESANMAAPDDKMFRCPDTPSSVVNDTQSEQATPDKDRTRKSRKSTLALAAEEASEHGHGLTAADLYEYHWPQEEGAEWYMLQEQISLFLDITSFKRKYPDLTRRVCDKHEKDYLREKGVVSETQSDLGLTALKSDDVHELMNRDYPAKYQEFMKAVHEKEKQKMRKKQKDYSLPKLDKSKMAAYTKKAMKSASEWNTQLLKERNEERRAYFDMQTFAVHYPTSKFRKLETVVTDTSPYQVALIPGQFQEYCRKYTPEELKYFPLNTALVDPPKEMINSQQAPEPDTESHSTGSREEVASQKSAPKEDDSSSSSESGDESSSASEVAQNEDDGKDEQKEKEKSTSREASAEKSAEREVAEAPRECRICVEEREKKKGKRKSAKVDEELISCSECKKSGHPSCLDLTGAMVRIIKTYPWQCMECKTCVECMDPYDEDKMLFCDRCDRGYHTFCVGLRSLPSGKWECKSCAADTTDESQKTPKPIPKSSRSGRKIKPVNPK